MLTAEVTPSWRNSPILYELRVKVHQRQEDNAKHKTKIGIIEITEDLYKEILEILLPDEQYTAKESEVNNIMFMGYILVPY